MPQDRSGSKATTTIRVSSDLIEEARALAAQRNPPLEPSCAIEACIREGMRGLEKDLRVLKHGLIEGKPRKKKR